MKIIAHISDIHYGTEIFEIEDALMKDLKKMSPDVVVISGDLTQRAKSKEFKSAEKLIEKINLPLIVVPGNHDIPLFNVFKRFFTPFTNYEKYITTDYYPFYQDSEIAILGINTSRSYYFKEGKISLRQIEKVKDTFLNIDKNLFKVLVIHHPLVPTPNDRVYDLLNNRKHALKEFKGLGIDLVLGGHLHTIFNYDVKDYYPKLKLDSMIFAMGGSAFSYRNKGNPNGYNIVKIHKDEFTITSRIYLEKSFQKYKDTIYIKKGNKWEKFFS